MTLVNATSDCQVSTGLLALTESQRKDAGALLQNAHNLAVHTEEIRLQGLKTWINQRNRMSKGKLTENLESQIDVSKLRVVKVIA